ncbi:MAG TPA: heavy metal-binding domain-containing protein, partial [Candidatus Saccharimonadales bacterium]|nr:heavy metal-binding domain-containing protein [Candidatus Saccharimonadales bacterium]
MKSKLILFATLLIAAIGLGVSASSSVTDTNTVAASAGKTLYTCGMHPWIIEDHPGNCPICGMKLVPIHNTSGTVSGGSRKILYYKSTMIAGETSPNPGKDSMGMDMVPVYANEAAAASSSAIAIDPATIQLMNIQTTEIVRGPLRR